MVMVLPMPLAEMLVVAVVLVLLVQMEHQLVQELVVLVLPSQLNLHLPRHMLVVAVAEQPMILQEQVDLAVVAPEDRVILLVMDLRQHFLPAVAEAVVEIVEQVVMVGQES